MPTPIFLTGFEYQVLSTSGSGTNIGLFNTIDGAGTVVDTSVFRNGAGALKTVATASGANHRVIRSLASHTNQIGRIAIRISAAPAVLASIMEVGDQLATITYHQFRIKTDRTLEAAIRASGADLAQANGPVLSVDTWYVLDWHFDGDTTTERRLEWRVDGAAQTTLTATPATTGTAAFNGTRIGAVAGNAVAANYTLWADDWIVSTTAGDYPIGDGKVIALRPASDGTHSFTDNDFSTGDAGTQRAASYTDFYLMVDETAWSTTRDASDNIAQRVIRSDGYVEINPGDTPESGTANGVRALLAYSSSGTTSNRLACIARSSAGFAGVIYGDLPVAQGGNGGATTDYSESSNFFKDVIVTKPGAGWTASEVNQIHWRLGGSGDVTPVPTVQALMLELDYPVSGATTHTKTGSGVLI